jgi:ATP-binding cassette subfamily G (WHITE) protein 1
VIGSSLAKGGISGGEKKRVAIGMELVTNPPILFLDEPTTGLDTYTAYSVMSTLKALAASGNNFESTLISDLFSKNSRTQILKSGLAADF